MRKVCIYLALALSAAAAQPPPSPPTLRLVGGDPRAGHPNGRVEVNLAGVWGSVCDDGMGKLCCCQQFCFWRPVLVLGFTHPPPLLNTKKYRSLPSLHLPNRRAGLPGRLPAAGVHDLRGDRQVFHLARQPLRPSRFAAPRHHGRRQLPRFGGGAAKLLLRHGRCHGLQRPRGLGRGVCRVRVPQRKAPHCLLRQQCNALGGILSL